MLLIILLHSLYGCTFVISKILTLHTHPIFAIGLRMFTAGILLSAFSFFTEKKEKVSYKIDKNSWIYLFQMAIIGTALPYMLRYSSLKYLTVTKSALIFNLSPFATLFFSYIFFKEKMTRNKIIGLLIGLSSIIPIITAKAPAEEMLVGGIGFLSYPEIGMITAVITYAYAWIMMKKLVTTSSIPTYKLNGVNLFIAGSIALSYVQISGDAVHYDLPKTFWFAFVLIIIMTNFICNNLYAYLLRKYSPTLLSLASLLSPMSAAIVSYFYFGETITLSSIITALLIFVGFIFFYIDEQMHTKH